MINVLEREDHLLNTKLVFKAIDEFTDEQAEVAFLGTEVKSSDDIVELVNYLKQYRPSLYKKLGASVKLS